MVRSVSAQLRKIQSNLGVYGFRGLVAALAANGNLRRVSKEWGLSLWDVRFVNHWFRSAVVIAQGPRLLEQEEPCERSQSYSRSA